MQHFLEFFVCFKLLGSSLRCLFPHLVPGTLTRPLFPFFKGISRQLSRQNSLHQSEPAHVRRSCHPCKSAPVPAETIIGYGIVWKLLKSADHFHEYFTTKLLWLLHKAWSNFRWAIPARGHSQKCFFLESISYGWKNAFISNLRPLKLQIKKRPSVRRLDAFFEGSFCFWLMTSCVWVHGHYDRDQKTFQLQKRQCYMRLCGPYHKSSTDFMWSASKNSAHEPRSMII